MPFRSVTGDVEPLPGGSLHRLRPLLADPAVSCFAEARLFPMASNLGEWGLPTVLGYFRGGSPASAVMLGANLVPIGTDAEAREALAGDLIRMGRSCSSIVGPADEVLHLWRLLEPAWGPAREIRPQQPLMSLAHGPSIDPDPAVQPVPLQRLEEFLPASIAMFTEEVGVDPRLGGLEDLYRRRVADLLRARRAFARWDAADVVFKAELGAVTPRAVQIQGVWVDPQRRGEGLAEPGMAAVAVFALARAPLVTLYVNSFNAAALATYRAVGFRQVATFATVLF